MCGISGIYNYKCGKHVDPAVIYEMNSMLHHRGPDDHGSYIEGTVGLGHRRLSIIDLKTGRQPINN